MCGVAGISLLPGQQIPMDMLDTLVNCLGHRGPDGTGRYIDSSVVLLHTRLAIIDLENGSQPISDDKGLTIIANGEVYNNKELRESLLGPFKTGSDCEPPLALYSEFGHKFSKHLRGMWGIAIHDSEAKSLILSRDPFGIKPLYYAETAYGLVFASEPRALITAGFVSVEINNRARDELLTLQFTTGAETIYQGINRVLPGETLVVKEGRIENCQVNSSLPAGAPLLIDENDALEQLDDVFLKSVNLHQQSDVPYGMFLSGGIDSTALLVAMTRLSDKPVQAYTACFDSSVVADESEHAAAMAKLMGAKHQKVLVDEKDFWTVLPHAIAALDDPTIDYAILPTFKLASVASNEIKVVLSGEGGDELFGGYGRYRKAIRPWWQGGARPMRNHSALLRANLLRHPPLNWREGILKANSQAENRERSSLQVAQANDCSNWLPNDLLIKLDRCLMAHGIEGRTPFLDPFVAELAFRLPDKLKIHGRLGKWLLRNWLSRQLPESRAFERKRGFSVPIGEWINGRAQILGPLVAAQPGVEELCERNRVCEIFKRQTAISWSSSWILLFYALWHNYHILGKPIGADIAESLS